MTDEDTTPTKLEISPAQIAGSALAAVSSAFFASWAGTAGTFIGVAAGSVIATVGAATYTWWLRRTQAAVRRTAAQVRLNALSTNALPRTIASGPLRTRRDETLTDIDARDAAEGRTGDDTGDADDRPLWRQWDLPWKKVLLTSVAVMFVALATITAFEAVTGRSVASFTGQDDPHGSTLGNAFDSGSTSSTKNDETTKPSPTPTPTPSSDPTPSDTATGGTGTDPGTGEATTTPVPTPTPSVEPTPTPSADPSATPGTTP